MRTSNQMTEGKEYCNHDWQDNNAIFYTLQGNAVDWFTLHRYGKGTSGSRSIQDHDAFVAKLERLTNQDLVFG